MRLRYLLEGVSDQLFHITMLNSAREIMRDNEFILSTSRTSEARMSKKEFRKYPYYLSAARSMNSGYIKDMITTKPYVIWVAFELDGRKLSYRYRGRPIDYFNKSYEEKKDHSIEVFGKFDKESFLTFFEHEDRIFSSKEKIDDFDRYVKAVHIIGRREFDQETYLAELKGLKKPYPIYVYDNRRDFLTTRTEKAEKL